MVRSIDSDTLTRGVIEYRYNPNCTGWHNPSAVDFNHVYREIVGPYAKRGTTKQYTRQRIREIKGDNSYVILSATYESIREWVVSGYELI